MSGTLQQLVAQHRVDLAITYSYSKQKHLHYTPLMEERFYLIANPPASPPLSGRDSVSLSEVLDLPLIMPEEKHGLRELMEREAMKLQQKLSLAMEVNAWPLMTDLVRRGLGYTVLSYASVHEMLERDEVIAIPITNRHSSARCQSSLPEICLRHLPR